MSQIRRRFSVFQREHKITVGPLGLDVPVPDDTTAFPIDDQVDEEDRLSDVEYSAGPSDHERLAKRRRIESNARGFLSGRRLEIYTATLRGPVKKNYWSETTTVVEGTALELKAFELKEATFKAQRDAKKRQPKRPKVSDGQIKLTSSFRSIKSTQTPPRRLKGCEAVDSSQNINFTSSQVVAPEADDIINDSQADSFVPIQTQRPDFISEDDTKVQVIQDEATPVPIEPQVVLDTDFTRNNEHIVENDAKGNGEQPADGNVSWETFDETIELLQSTEADTHAPVLSELDERRKPLGLLNTNKLAEALVVNAGDTSLSDVAMLEDTTPNEKVLDIDMKSYDHITALLEVDESSNFFSNGGKPKPIGNQSPTTALKASLRKIDMAKHAKTDEPPSPTTAAFLRKAKKPVLPKKRNDLGHSKSLKEIIAMKQGPNPKRVIRKTGNRRSLEPTKLQESVVPAGKIGQKASVDTIVEENAAIVNDKSDDHGATAQASAQGSENIAETKVPPVSIPTILGDKTDAPLTVMEPEPTASDSSSSQPKVVLRLSQLPTPLPPSPLTLVTAPQQSTPSIPESIIEETIAKLPSGDVSLKENEPAFIPGPRKAKRTAPKPRPRMPAEAQPSSNEQLKAALAKKISTPVSKLQQKIAEFSPVSPMGLRPISPIPELDTPLQSQTSSTRLQEKIQEQQKGSQLSSPPPSSPAEIQASTNSEIVTSEIVQVPASSRFPVAEYTEPELMTQKAPPSPPQEPEAIGSSSHGGSTIAMSSGQYRRIEESLRNTLPVPLPPLTNEPDTSHISASHPEAQLPVPQPSDTANIPEPEDQPEVQENLQPIIDIQTPRTPDVDTLASRFTVPDSFKMAIAAPINFEYQTPSAPLPPPFVPSTTSNFTPINSRRVVTTSPLHEPTTPTNKKSQGLFTSPLKNIEFTPFRSINSPLRSVRESGSDLSMHEPTTIVSPFTFSQFMKPVEGGTESPNEVSKLNETQAGSQNEKETQSSYNLENILDNVDDYLLSDVYDVEEDARRITAEQSFEKVSSLHEGQRQKV